MFAATSRRSNWASEFTKLTQIRLFWDVVSISHNPQHRSSHRSSARLLIDALVTFPQCQTVHDTTGPRHRTWQHQEMGNSWEKSCHPASVSVGCRNSSRMTGFFLGSSYPQMIHGAGILTYIETPFLWPSFVGKYTILIIRSISTVKHFWDHVGRWGSTRILGMPNARQTCCNMMKHAGEPRNLPYPMCLLQKIPVDPFKILYSTMVQYMPSIAVESDAWSLQLYKDIRTEMEMMEEADSLMSRKTADWTPGRYVTSCRMRMC